VDIAIKCRCKFSLQPPSGTLNASLVPRTLLRAGNYLICTALWLIGRAIFRIASNFLPALRERRVPALPRRVVLWRPSRATPRLPSRTVRRSVGPAQPMHRIQTGAHQVAHRLMPDIGNPCRCQLARPMRPRQAGRVAPIGLDPISGTPSDQRWRNHDALVPVPRQVTLDAMAPPPRLIAEPKPHTLAPELAQQTVQGRRGVRDPAVFPDLAERATLGHRHDDPFLVNIKPNVCDTIRQDPSPMHEARHRPIGATLSICIP